MSVQVSRILHAGYIFEHQQTKLIFDPIFENPFSRNCFAYPDVKFDLQQLQSETFTAIFISHFHDDHCSLVSLNLLDRRTPIYLYCQFTELFTLLHGLGFSQVHPLELNVPVRVGGFTVTPRLALEPEVDCIFQIQAGSLNILNVVDAWIDPKTIATLTKVTRWDLVLWPFQAMRETELLTPTRIPAPAPEVPMEWIDQLRELQPRILIPSSCQFRHESWSWYNQALFPISYKFFFAEVSKHLPQIQQHRLNPGQSFILEDDGIVVAPPLRWVRPVGLQDVDYQYDQEQEVPSTRLIAQHFPSLRNDQQRQVMDFLEHEILFRFNNLEPSPDPYFLQNMRWRLTTFDHSGQPMDWQYVLSEGEMRKWQGEAYPLGWHTEVPITKLFAALAEGESLTSMYLRINNCPFSDEIEAHIGDADILQDPLIRCLFSGSPISYQQAQSLYIMSNSSLL